MYRHQDVTRPACIARLSSFSFAGAALYWVTARGHFAVFLSRRCLTCRFQGPLALPACHSPRCPEHMSFPFRGAPLYWVTACGHLSALLSRAPVISLHRGALPGKCVRSHVSFLLNTLRNVQVPQPAPARTLPELSSRALVRGRSRGDRPR